MSFCCPTCGNTEEHPVHAGWVLIRAFKVTDDEGVVWSQCLVCSGTFDKDLNLQVEKHDPAKGWFY